MKISEKQLKKLFLYLKASIDNTLSESGKYGAMMLMGEILIQQSSKLVELEELND